MPTPYALQPRNVRHNMGINAGVLLRAFDVESGVARREDIIGATDGPVRFVAKPRFTDLGAGVGNCPRNVREIPAHRGVHQRGHRGLPRAHRAVRRAGGTSRAPRTDRSRGF